MAILVTGGSGFLGKALVERLMKETETVVIFDQTVEEREISVGKNLHLVKGDITNVFEVFNVVRDYKVETIFHLAAMLSALCEGNPWRAINVNALGTYNVLEAARIFGVKKVIFTSSMGVYSVPRGVAVTEDTVQRPSLMYGVTKVFGELLGLYYHRRFGIDFRGVRFPQIFGPGVKTMGFGQYIPWLIEAAVRGERFEVWVPEEAAIPLMYVKDAVRALLMLYHAEESRLVRRVYNVGQILPPVRAVDVLNEVKKHFPDFRVEFRPSPSALEALKNIPSFIESRDAEMEWGWKIQYSLEEAVEDFIQELKKAK